MTSGLCGRAMLSLCFQFDMFNCISVALNTFGFPVSTLTYSVDCHMSKQIHISISARMCYADKPGRRCIRDCGIVLHVYNEYLFAVNWNIGVMEELFMCSVLGVFLVTVHKDSWNCELDKSSMMKSCLRHSCTPSVALQSRTFSRFCGVPVKSPDSLFPHDPDDTLKVAFHLNLRKQMLSHQVRVQL